MFHHRGEPFEMFHVAVMLSIDICSLATTEQNKNEQLHLPIFELYLLWSYSAMHLFLKQTHSVKNNDAIANKIKTKPPQTHAFKVRNVRNEYCSDKHDKHYLTTKIMEDVRYIHVVTTEVTTLICVFSHHLIAKLRFDSFYYLFNFF